MRHEGERHDTEKVVRDKRKPGGRLWLAILVGLLIVIIFTVAIKGGKNSERSESYKKVSGAAGLVATIDYDCHKDCKQKYNFNVYIFNENGQQVSVARPDKDGKVQLAMAEGDYVMLVGKQFGKDKLFPQEKIALKNGQELNVKLRYNEGAL